MRLAHFPVADVADYKGDADNVKIRLHRARGGLKKKREEGCNFYQDERNTLACDRKQK